MNDLRAMIEAISTFDREFAIEAEVLLETAEASAEADKKKAVTDLIANLEKKYIKKEDLLDTLKSASENIPELKGKISQKAEKMLEFYKGMDEDARAKLVDVMALASPGAEEGTIDFNL